MGTKTGNFGIGFRRGGTEWQKDLTSQAKWAKQMADGGSSAATVIIFGMSANV